MKGVNTMQDEFQYTFVIDRMVSFTVSYYTFDNHKHPCFSTCVQKFNRSKSYYSERGQFQDRLLPYHSMVRDFWRKWDGKHLMLLTDDELRQMENDVEMLKQNYPYVEGDNFYKVKGLSNREEEEEEAMPMPYRVSEKEELRMLLGKRHRNAEDVATVFEMMLEKCGEDGTKCEDCSLNFGTKTALCYLMRKYVEQYSIKEK